MADPVAVGVEIPEPVERGALVVLAIPPPVLFHLEQVGEVGDQVAAWHDAACEEVVGDPVGGIVDVEAVGRGAMREDVRQQAAIRAQPGAATLQQGAPVRHVLEHLDGDDAIETLVRVEHIHVGGDDADVGQPLLARAALDEGALAG